MFTPAIDKAVKEFADETGLDYALRPHGEHIWYVRKRAEADSDFFQQVQVAIFDRYGDGGSAIFFTPFAYVVMGSNTRTTPAGAASPCLLPLMGFNPHKTEALKKVLTEAWSRARQLKRSDVSATPVS
jgi:hypothetical protein